ncbi:hypothetical protein CISIN_1g022123mg [Citrus sinensis]|uniref:Myb/SANT-like domain-containing protein n=1 Tax=Citrus sinensis TaxID=2711 RepID=A0A067F186_CITSI|nr:hypothetical protein CISIN_1g022123mg [Citrus sinensis]
MESQAPKSRFWSPDEDVKLVESLLDLYHEGRFCVDNNFKSGYLKVLETALETKLPGCGIKAKPHIESRIKTLKMQFRTLHDMLTGPNCRGFNWDPQRKIVTAEKAVWDAYIQAANFKNKAFPHYEDLCTIYGKDHATGRNAVAPADVVEKIERTRVNNGTEGKNLNLNGEDVRNDVDDNMAFSHTRQMHPKTSNSSSRKRGRDEDSEDSVESLKELAILIVREMKESSSRLSQAIGQEINDKQVGLNGELKKITSLTTVERLKATRLIARDNAALNVFYSLSDEDRKVWVKLFLSGEI